MKENIMADKLKAAVIGLGTGTKHANGYLAHPDVELVAVAAKDDVRSGNLEKLCPGFKGRVYEDAIEMLSKEKPDIVSVADRKSVV